MRHDHEHLIIGGGMSGAAAAQAIHDTAPDADIGMLGAEQHPPYDRPPLSKALWKDTGEDTIWRPISATGATLHRGRRAVGIDADAHLVTDDHGDEYRYCKLLIATGGAPRRLSFAGDRVLAYRNLDDYHRLRELAREGSHVAVVGGGFIGCEVAAALAMNGVRVSLVFPESALGARVYPAGLSRYVHDHYRERGVELHPGRKVQGGEQRGERVTLQLDDGSTLAADAVVAGLGIELDTQLAVAAGARVDNGIVVDECMRTSVPDILAAGDVASFPSPAPGHRLRVEHEDAANATGRHAGLAMAGAPTPYTQLPFFYSDLFDLGYEAVGTLDARLETVEDWVEPNRAGVVYYLDDGHVRGVLLWNTWDQVPAARELIGAGGSHDRASLIGRIRG